MIIGILKETTKNEFRVSANVETVKKLIKLNHQVIIEKDSGLNSSIKDEEYINAGAKIKNSSKEIFDESNLILKVNPLSEEELNTIKDNTICISFFQIKDQIDNIDLYLNKNLTLLSMSHIPRTTLAQKMDALSSQSNIAGYKAVIIGSNHIQTYMPLLMTAAGTIQPAKVLILGAGVAGLSAIATAKRLGAQVFAFDVRAVVKEQVESLGAKFIEVETDADEGTGEGGYAKEVSEDYKKKQGELLNQEITKMDLVITTALIPERPAPILITKKMVESMKHGSTIMDLAASNGGNCEFTKADEIINHNGVIIDGYCNLPSTMAFHASQLYAKNIYNLIEHIYQEETLNFEEEITQGSTLIHNGEIMNNLMKKMTNKDS